MGCDSLAWEELAGLWAGLRTTSQVLVVGWGHGGTCGVLLSWCGAGQGLRARCPAALETCMQSSATV